ncbi:hypothetical protein BJV82DRAFT_615363 [Fennellomyces sp. T-0311]|nr:hypothetical protein BJV82DRAFT_615363 [Fennellomyces sp. T-0311]
MSKSSVGHPRSASYNSTEDEVDIDEEPVDTGLIRCICSSSEDDGFTIQCERCLVWQHAFCVRISQNNIPEHYLCDQCERKFGNPSTPWRNQLEQFSKAVENDVRSVLDKKLRQRPEFRDNGVDKQHFRDIYNRIGDDDDYKPGVANRRHFNGHKKNPVGRPPKRPKLSKKIAVSKRSLQELELQGERRKRAPQDDGQPAFQRISYNLVRSKHARQVFKDAHERWRRLEKGKEKAMVNGTTPSVAQHIVTDDCLEKDSTTLATVRPLSKRWQYSSSERQGLFADSDIEKNQLVAQVNGDIVLKSEYKFDTANDFVVLGTPCRHVFFYPTLDLCIDARCRGNDVRTVRRSCHPNAELRGIIAPHAQDHEIRLGLFARKDIKQDDELTIGWNWQRGHISWKKNLEWHDCGMTDGHQVIDEEEERGHRSALTQMLNRFSKEFGDCACQDINLCFIEHLKAILSGSDESPLTSFKPPKQDVVVNGTASRAEGDHGRSSSREPSAQPSRQTIVSGSDHHTKTGQPTESGEDSIVIDVVSTSPLVRSPVISTPARVSDTEEELDVDGDIDVGDETMDYVPTAPERPSSSERSLSRASSVSSYSGTEGEARKRTRRLHKANGEKPSKRQSVGPHDDKDMSGPAKLPCKKAWMRNFMQQASPAPAVAAGPMDTSKDEPEIPSEKQKEAEQADIKSEPENMVKEEPEANHTTERKSSSPPPPSSSSPSSPPPPKIAQPVMIATAVMDIEDDGELSDASSASTIPIIEQEDDRLNSLTGEEDPSDEVVSQQEQQADDTEALSSETDEQLKPTKVKLSLQEYLARRGTSAQSSIKVANGDKSQDCSANTEEHPWMTATNQVEVTMEVRQREAQH